MERSSSTRSPYLITVDPGGGPNCRVSTAQVGRPLLGASGSYLRKSVCRTANTQQYSEWLAAPGSCLGSRSNEPVKCIVEPEKGASRTMLDKVTRISGYDSYPRKPQTCQQ
jgi:hypothetical protein